MGIRLKTLTLHNWGLFKDETIDFDDKDIIGILAEYAGDKNRSNRAGKSLIPEAIKYNLIGKTRASKVSDMIHFGEDEMYVKALYYDDETEEDLEIYRGCTSKGKGILNLNWIEKSREAQKEIGERFGVFADDFELTCFFDQDDIHGFMKKTPAEMTRFLMQWFDNSHWTDKQKLIDADIKILKEKLRDNEAEKRALEASLETDSEIKVEIVDIEEKQSQLESKRKELKEKLAEIEKKKRSVLTKRKEAQKEVADIERRIREQDLTEKKRKKASDDRNKTATFIDQAHDHLIRPDVSKDDCISTMATLKSEIKASKARLKTMKENSHGVCPIINQSCDRIKFSPKDIKDLDQEIVNKYEEYKKLDGYLVDHKEDEKLNKQIEQAQRDLETATSILEETFTDTREDLKKRLKSYDKAQKSISVSIMTLLIS